MLAERATLAWNCAEAALALLLGAQAGSLAMMAFGLGSVAEVFACLVVLAHLSPRLSTSTSAATCAVGVAFLGAALALAAQAVVGLSSGQGPDPGLWSAVFMSASTAAMLALGVVKSRLAALLDDAPLAANARLTLVDGLLGACVLASVVAVAVCGWWWADGCAALVLSALLVREGVSLVRGEHH